MVATVSLIDSIPGARAAYDYVLGKLAEFYVIGTQRVPSWRSGAQRIEQMAQQRGLTTLAAKAGDARVDVGGLSGSFQSLAARIDQVRAMLYGPDGSTVRQASVLTGGQIVVLLSVAGLLLTFFVQSGRVESKVSTMVNQAVADGLLTPTQAAAILRGGGLGGALDRLGTTALVLGALAGLWFFTRRR